MLELGLPGQRVDGGQGQCVAAQSLEKALAPVHGQPGLARSQGIVCLHRQDQAAAAAAQCDQVAVLKLAALQILGVQAECRGFDMAEQAGGRAGAAHAVPLVAQAPAIEDQRVVGGAGLLGRQVGIGMEAGAAGVVREASIRVEARGALISAGRKWPLLRAQFVQACVAQPGQVEVAPSGQ